MLQPEGLDHVAILVSDIERSLQFYQSLGLALMRTSGPDDEGVRSAVIGVGKRELNLFSRPGLVRNDAENLLGMHHYCISMRAGSIEKVIDGLERAGIEIFRGPVERRDGTSVFVHDPDGVRVELRVARGNTA